MVQRFPTPRLETDDGNQDIADLHAREDLLLNHYSWVDRSQWQGAHSDRARDGDDRAARTAGGAATAASTEPLMAGDRARRSVTAPLTNGFARTGYEQQYMETLEQQQMRRRASRRAGSSGARTLSAARR